MSQELNDHELTVLVDAAARGSVNSRVAHHGGPLWEALSAGRKNELREAALPFIYHGTKVLADLGWRRPQTATTVEELDALPHEAVIRDAEGHVLEKWGEPHEKMWATVMVNAFIPVSDIALPATLIYEPPAGDRS